MLASVERDLAAIATVAPELAQSALAATALALAREIDASDNSATSISMCAGQLRDTLDRLRELMPPKKETDGMDDLIARREARRAGNAAAQA